MDRIRVLIAKPGLDGHDRGALVISQALRDAGMEVIYTGLRQSPQQIVRAAVQEDVDVIGLSSLSGAHNVLFPAVVKELHKQEAEDIIVIGGGVIPADDAAELERNGIEKIFTPGTPTGTIAAYIEETVKGGQTEAFAPVKRIDHIGIAVHSIEETASFYSTHFQLKVEKVVDVAEQGVRVAFIPAGNVKLELLEPLGENSPITQFLDKRGGGLHHIAVEVDNIEERLNQMRKSGVALIDDIPKTGASGHPIAFLHPKAAHGTLVELLEGDDQDGYV
ncbi:methylmalonyl-CoA epimerase [Alkalicoccus luteus]|uniref:Methylmalonyl-CoA epimerase n=1 Tax=Alkalicoccus luteus TaxID=1237094 RepID=A0A969PU64_9BACI|nr:methylmalonyl-CoA epimerase [Alkalicoccus luteus]NJP37609.1 methylmalonyl-CoA epimerase [Alkalicoccus luteus]